MENIKFKLYDIVESNGKTIKENNLDKKHNIPIGSLVEFIGYENYEGVRMYIVSHDRDCDGTPLYSLSADKTDVKREREGFANWNWVHGCSEDSLKVIKD